jgi:hypothetical protein
MTTIAAERAVAIGSMGEEIGIIARDPAKFKRLAANISLN